MRSRSSARMAVKLNTVVEGRTGVTEYAEYGRTAAFAAMNAVARSRREDRET